MPSVHAMENTEHCGYLVSALPTHPLYVSATDEGRRTATARHEFKTIYKSVATLPQLQVTTGACNVSPLLQRGKCTSGSWARAFRVFVAQMSCFSTA